MSDTVLRDNLVAGFQSYGPSFTRGAPAYANADLRLNHVIAHGNRGDPADKINGTGSGIVLGSVRGGSVTRSVAYDNGGAGGARSKGPIGIWAYDSTAITLAHDVSYRNRSGSPYDGGGFGLDQNTSNSVMEYNLSYGNHGHGFLLYSAPRSSSQSGNTVRFDISYRDGPGKALLGGIAVSGTITRAAVYQNTAVMTDPGNQAALKVSGPVSGLTVANNIFQAGPGGQVVADVSPAPGSVTLAGNDYFATAGNWYVRWGSTGYNSLAAWRDATGAERAVTGAGKAVTGAGRAGGQDLGLTVDPRFARAFPALPDGAAGGPGSGAIAAALPLGKGSPLRGVGLDLLAGFGIAVGPGTWEGQPYQARAPDLGS